MVEVRLSSASNGVIKKVIDNNFNGGGDRFTVTTLYAVKEEDGSAHAAELLNDLVVDLGLDIGTSDGRVVSISSEWGEDYMPSLGELSARIRSVSSLLRTMRTLRKQMVESNKTVKGKR